MADPDNPEPLESPDSAPLGPETEADVRGQATHEVDPDDMFDPFGT